MKVDVIVPASGESIKEGEIKQWYKNTGDWIKMDEPLLSLETDKATLEIPASVSGRLTTSASAGETVKVGAVIGYIETETTEAKSASVTPAAPKKPSPEKTKKSTATTSSAEIRKSGDSDKQINHPSPAARKMLAESDIPASAIIGTARDGRITKGDVIKYQEDRQKPQPEPHANSGKSKAYDSFKFYESDSPVVSPDETIVLYRQPREDELPSDRLRSEVSSPIDGDTDDDHSANSSAASSMNNAESAYPGNRNTQRVKMSRLRRTIANRLLDAQQSAALLTTFNEVDMNAIIEIRAKHREEFKKTFDIDLSFMSFFTKAVCLALKSHPIINAHIDKNEIIYHDYCDIGIAVSTDKGLVVPIIRNAETLSFADIEKTIARLANKARKGEISLDDLTGGTFTITNGGVFGSMLSTPIINPPQSAILGMHTIIKRPIAKDDQVIIRPMMYLALTYDHRLIDGADAVKFLVNIKQLCETPLKLLLHF